MKSIRMNCPSVIVFVKYAFPRQMALTFFTNSTRLLSRASMKVLIRIPERRHSATSRCQEVTVKIAAMLIFVLDLLWWIRH